MERGYIVRDGTATPLNPDPSNRAEVTTNTSREHVRRTLLISEHDCFE